MAALDLRYVEKSGGIPDQRPARKVEPRDRLKPALVERPGAIGNPSTALEEGADRRMRLKALEFLERVQKRVFVIEPDHEPDRHLPIVQVIKKGATVSRRVERPADRMNDEAGLVPLGRDLPQFLDSNRVSLRVDAVAKAETLHQPLGQRASATLREQCFAADQLNAGLVAIG